MTRLSERTFVDTNLRSQSHISPAWTLSYSDRSTPNGCTEWSVRSRFLFPRKVSPKTHRRPNLCETTWQRSSESQRHWRARRQAKTMETRTYWPSEWGSWSMVWLLLIGRANRLRYEFYFSVEWVRHSVLSSNMSDDTLLCLLENGQAGVCISG
jgi:hypothetical protein